MVNHKNTANRFNIPPTITNAAIAINLGKINDLWASSFSLECCFMYLFRLISIITPIIHKSNPSVLNSIIVWLECLAYDRTEKSG